MCRSFKNCFQSEPEPDMDSDILFQDDLVCILKPNAIRGVLVYSSYSDKVNIQKDGLKSGEMLQFEGISTGRVIHHSYIFFRAPYYSRQDSLEYSSLSEEIKRLYGSIPLKNTAWIRVDPDQTYVFSSEIRSTYIPYYTIPFNSEDYHRAIKHELKKSKKTLTAYMDIISLNRQYIRQHGGNYTSQYMFHLYSSEVKEFPKSYRIQYPYNKHDVSRNSEILVRLPHLPVECFAYYE